MKNKKNKKDEEDERDKPNTALQEDSHKSLLNVFQNFRDDKGRRNIN